MHLLVVDISWPPTTFLQRLLYGLADAGLFITVVCSQRPERTWLARPNCRWLRLPGWHGGKVNFIFNTITYGLIAIPKAPSYYRNLRSIIPKDSLRDRLKYWSNSLPLVSGHWDVVYFPWNSAAIAYLPLAPYLPPMVVSCRGSQVNIAPHEPERAGFAEGLRQTFQKAAAVHCVSEAIQNEAMQYGLEASKAWIIRPAVDPAFFCPSADKKIGNPLRIITTGSMIWRKGYEYALRALRLLLDQGIAAEFQLIGDGPERARVLYTIDDLELHQQVHLHGKQPSAKVRELLQAADIFLLTSLSEGISNAALEAMACGLPVVTTDCGGMREAVTDGVEGFVVPVGDSEAIAAALARLARDPALRERMGQAARQRVLRDFTLKEQIQAFVALFEAAKAVGRSS